MPSTEPIAVIRREGERMLQLAGEGLDRPVPQYPGWTLGDLLEHTASVHGRTVLICRDLPTERIPWAPRPEGVAVVDWFAQTLADMTDLLEGCDRATRVWGFGPDPTLGFWERRMVIETGVHRWDAESASGEPAPLGPVVARAGLEEFGDMWLPRLGDLPSLRVTATDMGESWQYGDGSPEDSIRGTASDLYLSLVSRPSPVALPTVWAEAVASLDPPPKA